MTALDHLSGLLRISLQTGERPFPHSDELNHIITSLQKHNKAGAGSSVPEDLQEVAVRKFWDIQRFETLKEARLVSFGMCVPSRPNGPCIMEDQQRFRAVLDGHSGVDQWVNEPRWYRRCYQGLLRSYFTYDAKVPNASSIGKQNWADLRDYLNARTSNIVDKKVNPDWVTTAVGNRQLFGDDPCSKYASDVLAGDTSKFEQLCEQLGIVKSSWFLRELVLAQVREATKLPHDEFKEIIPSLIKLLSDNQVLRDMGLILVLDKYASTPYPGINELLKNSSVDWWGNPWLPSNEMRWGGVTYAAREMVSEWLKREFIEAFFTKLAEDGVGDHRRANFWLRYVKSMDNIQFALGSRAMYSKDRDFEALREKMKGLYTELRTSDSSNNAFIMTLGDLVAVEFGGMGNAFYGYDIRKTLPFDVTRPVGTAVDARNSLKHKSRMLWMQHQDGIKGWSKWEDMFEATLEQHFDIRQNVVAQTIETNVPASNTATASIDKFTSNYSSEPTPPSHRFFKNLDDAFTPAQQARQKKADQQTHNGDSFSLAALATYAKDHSLNIENNNLKNGNLWVRTDDNNVYVNKVLLDWGFRYKAGKGWWK